jgi:DNA-binding beta-propeller fold protein YncE
MTRPRLIHLTALASTLLSAPALLAQVTVTPAGAWLRAGASCAFTAHVPGPVQRPADFWQWRVEEPGGGTIIRDAQGRGVYTPPPVVWPRTFHVLVSPANDPGLVTRVPVRVTLEDGLKPAAEPDRKAPDLELCAGTPTSFGFQDGLKDAVRFGQAQGIVLARHPDPALAGAFLVADSRNHRIRIYQPGTGRVTTWLGHAEAEDPSWAMEEIQTTGGCKDGQGREARFNRPTFLAVPPEGKSDLPWRCVISDTGNRLIRVADAAGRVTLLAGVPGSAPAALDGPAAEATFIRPEGIAMDAKGFVYVADCGLIRRIADGQVTTLCSLGDPTSHPHGLALDPGNGLLYASRNHEIFQISLGDGEVRPALGHPKHSGFEEPMAGIHGGPERYKGVPCLNGAAGLTFGHGRLFISDRGNSAVRMWNPRTGDLITVAGTPPKPASRPGIQFPPIHPGKLGKAASRQEGAALGRPWQVALDGLGACVVTMEVALGRMVPDPANLAQVVISPANPAIRDGEPCTFTAQLPGKAELPADFWQWRVEEPGGGTIQRDEQGRGVYTPPRVLWPETFHILASPASDPGLVFRRPVRVISDETLFRQLMPNTQGQDWMRGTELEGWSGDPAKLGLQDGLPPEALFRDVRGIVHLPWHPDPALAGGFLVVDTMNHLVRVFERSEGRVRTWLGSANGPLQPTVALLGGVAPEGGFKDGKGQEARFNRPKFLAVPPEGKSDLPWRGVISDTGNLVIRAVDAEGQVTLLAGMPGSTPDQALDGEAAKATFRRPRGIAMDAKGVVYVADLVSIRKIENGQVTTLCRAWSAPADRPAAQEGKAEAPSAPETLIPFQDLTGLALDHRTGRLYVASGTTVIEVNTADGRAELVLGRLDSYGFEAHLAGAAGNGPRRHAGVPCLHTMEGLTFAHGRLFIADTGNGAIRVWDPATGNLTTLTRRQGKSQDAPLQVALDGYGTCVATMGWGLSGMFPDPAILGEAAGTQGPCQPSGDRADSKEGSSRR